MPVEFNCPHCQKLLRVPDESAGRKAECPACASVVDVPEEAGGQWRVQTPDGEQFGPITKAELERWVAEGRLTADFHVRQGDVAAWQPAARVFPSLLGETTASATSGYVPPAPENPYVSPSSTSNAVSPDPYQKEHRGGTILTLAILGLVFSCCFPLGIAAWVMGSSDLAEMRAGRMDRSGEGLTRAGQIIGIIDVGIFVLGILGNIGIGLMRG